MDVVLVCFLCVLLSAVVGYLCFWAGRTRSAAETHLSLTAAHVGHIDSLQRVHERVLALALSTRGPADMRDKLSAFVIKEMQRVKK